MTRWKNGVQADMSDYIKREDALEEFEHRESYSATYVRGFLKHLPSADVAPVRHGRWIDKGDGAECSICGSFWKYDGVWDRNGFTRVFRYCETCGARMDEEADE